MPAKKPRKPILRRTLNAHNMKAITIHYHKKRIKPLNTEKAKLNEIPKMRKFGGYLLKRKFRSSPEEKKLVEILFQKKKPKEKADLIIKYLKKTKKTTTENAKINAVKLLDLIINKAEKEYKETYRKTAEYAHKKKDYVSGEEHMFSIHNLFSLADLVKLFIKDQQK